MKSYTREKNIWKNIGPVLLKKYKRDATFLDYKKPWQLVVAVVLSAQTTDEGVNRATPALFKAFPTPAKLAQAPIKDIEHYIKTLGFYRAKAVHIKSAMETLVREFKGKVPSDPTELQRLRGVGRKSAVAIISNLYPEYANIGIPVDTHVIRFVKRFNLSTKRDPSKIEQDLLQIIPQKDWKRAGYAIKEYGRKEGRARGYKRESDPLVRVLNS